MSLAAENLSYRVGRQVLLDNLSLSLDVGKIVVVIGTNGAGKSTLLNLLAGCPTPTAGRVLLENKPLSQWSWVEIARRRAILTQSITMAFDFSVADVVRLGALPYQSAIGKKTIESSSEQVMHRMSVAHLRDQSCADLSGGECQRVQLARVLLQSALATLMGNPAYLLLDEPLSALDLEHQFHLLKILRELVGDDADNAIGIAAVMHDLNMAFQCADSVVLMQEGKIFCQGETKDVIAPQHIRAALNVDISIESSADGQSHIVVEPASSPAPAPNRQ